MLLRARRLQQGRALELARAAYAPGEAVGITFEEKALCARVHFEVSFAAGQVVAWKPVLVNHFNTFSEMALLRSSCKKWEASVMVVWGCALAPGNRA